MRGPPTLAVKEGKPEISSLRDAPTGTALVQQQNAIRARSTRPPPSVIIVNTRRRHTRLALQIEGPRRIDVFTSARIHLARKASDPNPEGLA